MGAEREEQEDYLQAVQGEDASVLEVLATRDVHGSIPDEPAYSEGEYSYNGNISNDNADRDSDQNLHDAIADSADSSTEPTGLQDSKGGVRVRSTVMEESFSYDFDFAFTEEDTEHVMKEGAVSPEEEGLAQLQKRNSRPPAGLGGKMAGHTFGLDDLYVDRSDLWSHIFMPILTCYRCIDELRSYVPVSFVL